jgi:transcriptional regulator PpsR
VTVRDALQPDVKVVLDLKGVIRRATLANSVAEETVDDWVGRPWAETVDGLDDSGLTDIVQAALRDGVSPLFRLNQRFPSGLELPVEYMAVRLKGGDVVAIGRDVRAVAQLQSRLAAAQHSMERNYWQLREVENRYRLLFESSSDALAVVRASDFAIVEANPAAISALGLDTGELVEVGGQELLQLVRPSERQMVELTLKRAKLQGKAPRILAHLGPAADPWLLYVSVMDVDASDLMLIHLLPSTDAHAALPGIYASSVSGDDLVELSPDGMVTLDEQGYITSANPAFLELVQEPSTGAVIGTLLSQWLKTPGGDVTMLLESLRRHRVVRLFPTTIHGSLGSSLAAELSAVMPNASTPAVVLLYVRDVSRRLEGADRYASLARLLTSMTERLGKARLKELVTTTVGLVERHYIEAALAATSGNRTAAAKLLGLSRQSLYAKLSRYDITDCQDEG